jgi:Spy/CpxP family protein refolding chaperone
MRSVLLFLLILMLVAGAAIAEKQDKPERPSEGFKKERVFKMRGGKYSRMFLSIVHRTKNLDLDDEKKAEISKEAKKYLSSINESEKESRSLQIAFMKQLNSEEFDAAKLKTDIKEINKLEQQSAYNFIDGMQAIRKIAGPENFAELTPFTKVDRNALIELRQGAWKSQNQAEPKTKEDTSESN